MAKSQGRFCRRAVETRKGAQGTDRAGSVPRPPVCRPDSLGRNRLWHVVAIPLDPLKMNSSCCKNTDLPRANPVSMICRRAIRQGSFALLPFDFHLDKPPGSGVRPVEWRAGQSVSPQRSSSRQWKHRRQAPPGSQDRHVK